MPTDTTPDWVCPRTLRWVAEKLDQECTERKVDVIEAREKRSLSGITSLGVTRDVFKTEGVVDYLTHLVIRISNRASKQERQRALK